MFKKMIMGLVVSCMLMSVSVAENCSWFGCSRYWSSEHPESELIAVLIYVNNQRARANNAYNDAVDGEEEALTAQMEANYFPEACETCDDLYASAEEAMDEADEEMSNGDECMNYAEEYEGEYDEARMAYDPPDPNGEFHWGKYTGDEYSDAADCYESARLLYFVATANYNLINNHP